MDRTIPRTRPAFSRLRPGLAFAAVLALGTLAGCSSSSSSPAGTASAQADVASVTLHIGDQAGTGAEALLTAAGLINKLPFKVAWSDFTSGPPMLQAMAAGSVDVGGVGNAPPVFAAAGGDQLAIVGAFQANPLGSALLVPKGSLIAQAHRWANAHLAARAAVWAKASGLPLTVMTKAAADDYSLAVPVTPSVIASEQQVADAFTASGLIPVHVNFAHYVDTSFNATASAS